MGVDSVVGFDVGLGVGLGVGRLDGCKVGSGVGWGVGVNTGGPVGTRVGVRVGSGVGSGVGGTVVVVEPVIVRMPDELHMVQAVGARTHSVQEREEHGSDMGESWVPACLDEGLSP